MSTTPTQEEDQWQGRRRDHRHRRGWQAHKDRRRHKVASQANWRKKKRHPAATRGAGRD